MAHGDQIGDVIFDGNTVHYRCYCGQVFRQHHSAVDMHTKEPRHVGLEHRGTWTIDLGKCNHCGVHYFLNSNLPSSHPSPNVPHIEALIQKKGRARAILTEDLPA